MKRGMFAVGNKYCETGDVEKESEKYCFEDSESKGGQRSKRKKIVRKNKNCFLKTGIILGNFTAAGCWSNCAVGLGGQTSGKKRTCLLLDIDSFY